MATQSIQKPATGTCPRCRHGRLFREQFREHLEWACLQCGFRRDVAPRAPLPILSPRNRSRKVW